MPIFIVGFARSGTTLAQKLVSQHLGIPTLPETHYFEFLGNHEPAGGQLKPAAARALVAELGGLLKIDPMALKPLLARDEVPIRGLFLQIIGQQIGSQALADKGLWIEKTPGHAEHLERIHQMFPKARFVCMVRNPLHAFASRRELLESGKGWGEEWKPIEAFCALWSQHVRTIRDFAERHPGQLLILRLEDLAGDTESQLRRVREFVGPGFANPTTAPIEPGIIQPFETWKRDALKAADPAIADREGKILLDPYESWRVKTLLRDDMALLGYPTDAVEPEGLDELHRKLITSIDWYRDQFARRDALMDVKTARIRSLLNEAAEKRSGLAGKADGAPRIGAGRPGPAATQGAREAGSDASVQSAAAVKPGEQAPIEPGQKAGAKPGSKPAQKGGTQAGAPAAKAAQKPGMKRPGASARPAPDDDDSFPPPRPITLRGISGVNDNAAEFIARVPKTKPGAPGHVEDDDQ